ncbi:hypothetical protein SAMN05444003_2490 [Cognatiyoonia sediminum]|uniref:NAD(FAD)-utilizing dehydrogenase n=1 Tax=Cognatiyoonia sediminum TaxID=1508389 RepID=A0A1M5RB98_9RHOB|nr:TIGR03862 family flavoprotein [Cognatiyoonia sediminum]SHH23614.1 hypothetical protein SAMN05444003_2490 [Cognatiyoonia sediminum]
MLRQKSALIIGGGPAGLMAAEELSTAGIAVTIADAMPSIGRKFLMAGKSGLNLTKSEDYDSFLAAYGDANQTLEKAIQAFGPDDVVSWAEDLGQATFTGSTGRVFPKAMKASPLLRAWIARVGPTILTRHRWVGFDGDAALFETPEGPKAIAADTTILAMGGGSWARLGSDGRWADQFEGLMTPFRPSNCGFIVDWSPHMTKHLGTPIKGTKLTSGALTSRGEWVISERGIEGGGVYTVSREMRDGHSLTVDLLPDRNVDEIRLALSKARSKDSLTTTLRKVLKLDPAKIALFSEFGRPFPDDIAPLLKFLPIQHLGPRPIDEAISTAGGLRFDALTDDLMLKSRPGVFCAGEMLDWDAPTGGYLLTACFATGRMAGRAAVSYLKG